MNPILNTNFRLIFILGTSDRSQAHISHHKQAAYVNLQSGAVGIWNNSRFTQTLTQHSKHRIENSLHTKSAKGNYILIVAIRSNCKQTYAICTVHF